MGIKGYIPQGPILYLKEDEEEIFQPLIDAISKTSRDALTQDDKPLEHVPPANEPQLTPKNETQKTEKKKTNIKVSSNTVTPRKKSPPYEYLHIKTFLLNHDICKSVVEGMLKPEFYNQEIKGKGDRLKWYRGLCIVSEDPVAWKAYRDNPKNKDNDEFIKKLFGVDGLNTDKHFEFRTGGNRYLNAFIKMTGVIPTGKLVHKNTVIK